MDDPPDPMEVALDQLNDAGHHFGFERRGDPEGEGSALLTHSADLTPEALDAVAQAFAAIPYEIKKVAPTDGWLMKKDGLTYRGVNGEPVPYPLR
jgi:hypothetical protein